MTVGVPDLPLATSLELAREAEAAGFSSISVGESSFDSFTLCAAIATQTKRITVCAGVATWSRPPVLTATAAASVDEIASGRFVLGLGTMPAVWSQNYYGIDPRKPLRRMAEYVEVVRGALRGRTEEPFDYNGTVFTVKGYSRVHPPLRDQIPIYLAATRPQMAALAATIADGVLFNTIHTMDWLTDVVDAQVQTVEARTGRRVRRALLLRCSIDADVERAVARVKRTLVSYLEIPYLDQIATHRGIDIAPARAALRQRGPDDAAAAIPDALVEEMALVGPPEMCVAQLCRYESLADWILLAPPTGLGADEQETVSRAILTAPWPHPNPLPQIGAVSASDDILEMDGSDESNSRTAN